MRTIKALVGASAVALALTAAPGLSPAGAKFTPTICPAYGDGTGDSGGSPKIDTSGDPQVVTVDAPDGYLIDGYCVKAGRDTTFVSVDPPEASVDISSPNGKAVSHYSVSYVPDEGPSS